MCSLDRTNSCGRHADLGGVTISCGTAALDIAANVAILCEYGFSILTQSTLISRLVQPVKEIGLAGDTNDAAKHRLQSQQDPAKHSDALAD